MTHEVTIEKINQLISKFKNGHERYKLDALLNNVVNSLARGADPIDIIDQLITINNELTKKNIELASKSPAYYIINKDTLIDLKNNQQSGREAGE